MGYYSDYFRAEVRCVRRLTPTMIRITLGGDADLERFSTSGDPDERLVVVLPADGAHQAPAPTRMPDGTLDYPAGDPPLRSYTVRTWDPATPEMIIDFVAHEGGLAAAWAVRAEPGDVVYLSPARGWYRPPADAGWQLLAADLTGLPALGRIVEELPAGTRAHCVVEVADPGDVQEIATAGVVSWTWLVGGNGHGPSRLVEAVRDRGTPPGRGYLWFAGEAAASRAMRKYVRRELGWPAERCTILGYWRWNAEQWLARYQLVGAGLEGIYAQALSEGRSEGDALELYDDALEKAGL